MQKLSGPCKGKTLVPEQNSASVHADKKGSEETRADLAALCEGDKSLIVYFGACLTVGQVYASPL